MENRLQVVSVGIVFLFLLSATMLYTQDPHNSIGEENAPLDLNYEIADDTILSVNATWTSRTSATPTSFTDGDTLVGDHVVIKNIWTMVSPVETPEYYINMTGISLNGSLYETTNDSTSISCDTYELEQNATVNVTLIAWTNNGSIFIHELGNVTFHNFFTPEVDITEPLDIVEPVGDIVIKWTVTDNNADDEHFFEVLLSADGGDTFQLLARNLTGLTFTWDSSGFLIKATFVIMVRVFDNDAVENPNGISTGDYWPGLYDFDVTGTWSHEGPPAPTSSTPTPPTETEDPPLTMWFGLIGGIGIASAVIIVLFFARKRSVPSDL